MGKSAPRFVFVANVWAGIVPVSGREMVRGGMVPGAETLHEVTIRYRPDVTPRWRLRAGSRVFNVESVIDVDERRSELKLTCVEPKR